MTNKHDEQTQMALRYSLPTQLKRGKSDTTP